MVVRRCNEKTDTLDTFRDTFNSLASTDIGDVVTIYNVSVKYCRR